MSNSSLKKMGHILTPPPHWWGGAACGILMGLLALCGLGAWNLFDSSASTGAAAAFFLYKVSAFILFGLCAVALLALLEKIPTIYKCMALAFGCAAYVFFVPAQTIGGVTVLALWMLTGSSLLGGGLLSLLTGGKDGASAGGAKAWGSAASGAVLLAALAGWLFLNEAPFAPPHLSPGRLQQQHIALPDPADQGSYAFSRWSYGSGQDLHRAEYGALAAYQTEPVDGSSFIGNWDGITGWLRTLYWGFDSHALPVNAQVWMPEGTGPFPLILIVHGNHEMMTASDNGYSYLGELLASRGFITAAVDENFLNGSWLNFSGGIAEVPARGWLLLEHLKLWRAWNASESSPLYNKVDMQRIGLIGHSRGGEAIAEAAAFNQLTHFPGDGNVSFDYGFNIKALAAISPVDAQYKPGGLRTKLENIDYFVIHGSHDGDVRSFEGSGQYHRLHFTGPSYHFKAALYIYGANHGQFNTLWGKKDDSSPATALFDMAQIMPANAQQTIAKAYLSAFFEVALHGQTGYLPMFRSYRSAEQWLPKTVCWNEFADSNFLYVQGESDDIDIGKTSLKGGQRMGKHLDIWKQTVVSLKKGMPLRPVTMLGWKKNDKGIPSYTITLPPQGLSSLQDTTYLVLTLANARDGKSKGKKADMSDANAVDFTIELTDDDGHSASLPLSDYTFLPPPAFVKLMKASFLDPFPRPEHIFQSFEYPLSAFVAKNPLFNPQRLHTIRLVFDRTPKGKVILDTVAFDNRKETATKL